MGPRAARACIPTSSRSILPATQIRIEDAQQIVDEAYRSPIEGARKVIMVFDAERMRLNDAAANRLLKTLEEPPPSAMIVLVTVGRRPAAADDPLALPARRLRVPRRGCGRDRAAHGRSDAPNGRISSPASPEVASTAPARSTAGWGRCARRSSGSPPPSTARVGAVAAQAELAQAALRGALTELEAAQATEVEELDRRARGGGLSRTHAARPAPSAEPSGTSVPTAARGPMPCSKASLRSRPCTATPWPGPGSSD